MNSGAEQGLSAQEVIREPMFVMLIMGAALYLALGETGDGMLLLAAVVMVISLTLYHQRRYRHSVGLRKRSA